MSATLKPTPLSPQAEKDLFKDFPDWYLKPIVEQAMKNLKTHKVEKGEVVFKRLRAKFEKQFGKLRAAMWSHS